MATIQITPDLTGDDAKMLLTKLERRPRLITAHWGTLESLIAGCMERVYLEKNKPTKMLLTAVEYRARLLRKRATHGEN